MKRQKLWFKALLPLFVLLGLAYVPPATRSAQVSVIAETATPSVSETPADLGTATPTDTVATDTPTATATITATATATATRTATATGTATATATPRSRSLYMPIVLTPPPTPRLLVPGAGMQINSLAPVLTWSRPITGTYVVQVSDTSNFATSSYTITFKIAEPLPDQVSRTPNINLDPQKLYYWRVGVLFQSRFSYATSTFITPPDNTSALPPRPALLTPLTESTVPTTTVAFTWQAVPNALNYRIQVRRPDNTTFTSRLISVEPNAAVQSRITISGLANNVTYGWRVQALNTYGWSSYSTTPFVFTTAAPPH